MLRRQNQLQMQIHWERTEEIEISLESTLRVIESTHCNGINITFMSRERLLALSFPDVP